jgi:hypothetical protein
MRLADGILRAQNAAISQKALQFKQKALQFKKNEQPKFLCLSPAD